jgi:hypothetical protein
MSNIQQKPYESTFFLNKNTINSLIAYAYSCLEITRRQLPLKIAVSAKQCSPYHTVHRFGYSFQPSACIRLYNEPLKATSRGYKKSREYEYIL